MPSSATRDLGAGPPSTAGLWGVDALQTQTLADLVKILRRRSTLMAVMFCLVVAPALAYALLATRLYTASAVVLLEPRSSLSQADGMRYSFASDSALVDSQMKLLTSETVLRRAVDKEDLQDDAEFGAASGGVWWSIRRALGFAKSDDEQKKENVNATVAALAAATTVKRPERTYVMEVGVTSRDPRKAARLANAIAEAYIADQTDARGDISRREQDFLQGNIGELRRKIEKAENEVETYKAQNQIIGSSGKLVNEQLLTDINTELASARTRVAEAKSRHDQVRRVVASGRSIEALPEALKSPVIDKLRSQYAEIVRQEANAKTTLGDLHPQYREIRQQLRDTRRLINEELTRIAEGARNDLRIAESSERDVFSQVEALKREATSTNQSSVRLRELEREVDTSKAVLDNLLKAKGVVTRDSVDMPIARIIARATPPVSASSPRRIPIMMIAMTLGAGLAAIAAFAAEGLAATRQPQLSPPPEPRLALLRMPRPTPGESAFAEIQTRPVSPYSAAVRRLVARAPARRGPGEPATCFVVESGGGVEGAVLAANLAQAFVDAGRSVLLVELAEGAGPIAAALSRDLPVGAVQLTEGVLALGILARSQDRTRLVVAPGALGQRALLSPERVADPKLQRLGRPADFDVMLAYAPNAGMIADIDHAVARSSLNIVMTSGAPLGDDAHRALASRIRALAPDRSVLVETIADRE